MSTKEKNQAQEDIQKEQSEQTVDNTQTATPEQEGVQASEAEEQIEADVQKVMSDNAEYLQHSSADDFYASTSRDYYIDRYMKLLTEAKKELDIPIIASVCAKSYDSWIDYAERFAKCGADAIELDYYPISSNAAVKGEDVDKTLLRFAEKARNAIDVPLSLKIGYKYSSLANIISSLDKIGINGLVLFNRFFRPDIDIDKIEMSSANPASSPDEYGEAQRGDETRYPQGFGGFERRAFQGIVRQPQRMGKGNVLRLSRSDTIFRSFGSMRLAYENPRFGTTQQKIN